MFVIFCTYSSSNIKLVEKQDPSPFRVVEKALENLKRCHSKLVKFN